MPLFLRLVASALSGLALVFISAPANLHWLHWFAFVPMIWATRPGEGRRNALVAYAGGCVAIFILYFWLIETIIRFSSVPWVLALLVHLLFTGIFALPYALTFGPLQALRRKLGLGWVVAFPALWVTVEMIPALFPYYHGVSQYRNPLTWQLASVTGVTGLTFLVWMSNAMLAELVFRRQEGRPMPWGALGVVVALLAGNVGFGHWRHAAVEAQLAAAPVVRTAILQQNTTMEIRLSESIIDSTQSWVETTKGALDDQPDLIIWPEGTIPFNPDETRKARWLGNMSPKEFFSRFADKFDFHFLIGGGSIERLEDDVQGREWISYNSAYAFSRDGELVDRYDKMVPLPFGEYIPFADTFPWLRQLIQGPGDFRAGERPTVFPARTAAGVDYRYTVPICYEAILNGPMWDLYYGENNDPVDLFVVITNDAWFGDTASPHQHAMLTTVQAIQFGRPMVRSAYTGVSWIVEPHGDIVGETVPFTDVQRVEELRLGSVETLYVRGGWVFPYLCILGTLGSFAWMRRRDGDAADPAPTA